MSPLPRLAGFWCREEGGGKEGSLRSLSEEAKWFFVTGSRSVVLLVVNCFVIICQRSAQINRPRDFWLGDTEERAAVGPRSSKTRADSNSRATHTDTHKAEKTQKAKHREGRKKTKSTAREGRGNATKAESNGCECDSPTGLKPAHSTS